MTEDIITDLARFRDIPVIARTSTEVYRGKAHDVRAVGEALGVEYVLEGSLQIALHRLRVTAQLINTGTGQHVWSERYDRQVGDFFEVQDEIAQKIAVTLTGWQSPISQQKKAEARRKSPEQLSAYDYWLLGAAEKHKMTPNSVRSARDLFEKGLSLDPDFQPLVRDLAYTYGIERYMGVAKNRDFALKQYDALSARAVELDPQDPLAWQQRAANASMRGDFEAHRKHSEHALSLGPNNADLLVLASIGALAMGQPERGPQLADRALRLNPHHPDWWHTVVAPAYFHGGAFDKAYLHASKSTPDSPLFVAYLAMAAARLGKSTEAQQSASTVLVLDPAWNAEANIEVPPGDHQRRVLESARLATLPPCMKADAAEIRKGWTWAICDVERAKAAEAE
jgi:tetratricopeptide (TPR) repeat protein